MKKIIATMFLALFFSGSAIAQNSVYVNDQKLSPDELNTLKLSYGIAIDNGDYWYDPICGAWGYKTGPTQGFIPAGLNVGGRLKSNASNGTTGIFVNGRQLHIADVVALQQITYVLPGRFWLDDRGNGGYEGMPASFNLLQLARQNGGGSSFYRNSYTGIGAGSSGGTSYVMGKDWSVIID